MADAMNGGEGDGGELSFLIFDLDGMRFGLDAEQVLEAVWLPELTPVAEAPPWVVGMFSLRGAIVPVIDLHLRVGRMRGDYRLEDQVVVLKTQRQLIGLIVGEVLEVVELPARSIQPPPEFLAPIPGIAGFVSGVACVGDYLASLLDVSRLGKLPDISALDETTESAESGVDHYPRIAADDRRQFHARAMALRTAAVEQEGVGLGLAVIELSGEYFGIELAAVQEFCKIGQCCSIPGCPPHILGAMSLRGNLLTLIDPRGALNLPPAAGADKAVIARISARAGATEQLIGMAVDEVHDVVYLRHEELHAPPSALREQCGAEITATASYAGGTMTVLDLPALLAREEWVVNDAV